MFKHEIHDHWPFRSCPCLPFESNATCSVSFISIPHINCLPCMFNVYLVFKQRQIVKWDVSSNHCLIIKRSNFCVILVSLFQKKELCIYILSALDVSSNHWTIIKTIKLMSHCYFTMYSMKQRVKNCTHGITTCSIGLNEPDSWMEQWEGRCVITCRDSCLIFCYMLNSNQW